MRATFNRVGLDELCTVHEQCLGNGLPGGYRLWQAEIHVCGGKLVNVKPDVLWPCIFNQIFVWYHASKPEDEHANVDMKNELSTLSRPM